MRRDPIAAVRGCPEAGAPPGLPVHQIYDIAGPAAGVPEPGALLILLVAIVMLATIVLWRHP